MKKSYLVILLLLLGTGLGYSQTKSIKGQVIASDDGFGLPGVSVTLRGTSIGVATDFDGNYTITKIPETATEIQFTYIGMKTVVVSFEGKEVIDISMEADAIGLDEVVIAGLGVSRDKKALGYAVQEVDSDELNRVQQNSALGALSGKVAGIQVSQSAGMGGSSRILIRGANSIAGENQPLVVVDGIPMDNSNFNTSSAQSGGGGTDYGNMMNDIDPSTIETMSVLKGPAAAIYGSRASNGVILITTKKSSEESGTTMVRFNSSVSFDKISYLPEYQTKYGGGFESSSENGFQQVTVDGIEYSTPSYKTDESWGPAYDESVMVVHWDGWDSETPETRPWIYPENDYKSYFELGTSFVNSISISHREDNSSYLVSYSNTSVDGTSPNSTLTKHNFSVKGSVSFLERFKVNSQLSYARTEGFARAESGYSDNSVSQKMFQWGQTQLDYDRLANYKSEDGTQRTWNRTAWNDDTPKYSDNPYWIANENYSDDIRDRFFGNASLDIKVIEGLNVKGSIYGDFYSFSVRERTAVGSQAESYYSETKRINSEFNYELIANYTATLSDNFNLTAMAGSNSRVAMYDRISANTTGGLVVPNLYTLGNSVGTIVSSEEDRVKRVNSVFASASVGYKSLIYLDVTARNDWSSTLPEANNSYFYPSVSGSFIFSELIDNASWLDFAKVRLGWSDVGNDTDPYNVYNAFESNPDGTFNGQPRFSPDEIKFNQNLKPEKTSSSEFGLEASILKGRASVDFTYFSNVTTDQILPLDVSASTGYDVQFVNAGKMSNRGIELSLNGSPIVTDNLTWSVGVNFTTVNNELVELVNGVDALDIASAPFGGVYLRASVGDTYGSLWGTDYVYDENGTVVLNSNGTYAATPSLVPLGSVLPDYNMGLSTSLTYKSFDFSALVDIQQGGKFYSLTNMWGMYSGILEDSAVENDKGYNIREDVSNGGGVHVVGVTGDVTSDGDGDYIVANTTPYDEYVAGSVISKGLYHGNGTPAAQSVFDADYIKLREVTLGYNVNVSTIKYISSLRVSAFGKNLAMWGVDKKGFDPEATTTGSGNIQGIEGGLTPSSKNYGFNLSVGF